MWTLLLPFVALLARVHATDFDQPFQVNFIVNIHEEAKNYIWKETTDPMTDEQKKTTSQDHRDTDSVGMLRLLSPDDKRTFEWSNPSINEGKEHEVSHGADIVFGINDSCSSVQYG